MTFPAPRRSPRSTSTRGGTTTCRSTRESSAPTTSRRRCSARSTYVDGMSIGYPDPALTDATIVLRPWTFDDLGCVEEASTDARIPAGTTVPAHYTPDEGKAFVERQWSRVDNGAGISLAIHSIAERRAVGLIVAMLRPQPVGSFAKVRRDIRRVFKIPVRLLQRKMQRELIAQFAEQHRKASAIDARCLGPLTNFAHLCQGLPEFLIDLLDLLKERGIDCNRRGCRGSRHERLLPCWTKSNPTIVRSAVRRRHETTCLFRISPRANAS